jgi:UDP-N-acetylmuramate dehydrogenase
VWAYSDALYITCDIMQDHKNLIRDNVKHLMLNNWKMELYKKIHEDVSVKELSTFQIGGTARYAVEVEDKKDIPILYNYLQKKGFPVMVIGRASNTIFADTDLQVSLLIIKTKGIYVEDEDDKSVSVRVAAGEDWDGFVEYTIQKGWSGIEALSRIPGAVGFRFNCFC